MKRLLVFILLLLLAVAGAVMAQLNASAVPFDFYFSSTEAPLALLLYASLAIGVIAGILAALTMTLLARREAKRLRKRLAMCEKEIKNLREIPIKGQY